MIDWTYSLAGALTGFVVGLTGVGGGALMTPILLLVFGVSPVTAIATDLWFAAITKLVGARIHHANGQVDWQVAKRLWLGSLPLALFVVVLVSLGAQVAKVEWLSKAIGVVVLITAVGLLAAPKLMAYARNRRVSQAERFKAVQPVLTVISGAVLGLCVALTSVGAGALGSVANGPQRSAGLGIEALPGQSRITPATAVEIAGVLHWGIVRFYCAGYQTPGPTIGIKC